MVQPEDCLPDEVRAAGPAITRVAAGLSGAGVYRVDAGDRAFVLKISGDTEPLAEWQRRLRLQRLAADAGLAPAVIYVDEERRAVLSAFVVDRSFPVLYGTPHTRDAAIALLATTLRRMHDLPLPPGVGAKDARGFLATLWSGLATFAVPAFTADAVRGMLAEQPPAQDRADVLSHNDLNPTNLVYDGERLLLLDWATAGPNDPYYDLAAIAVFLRMDGATCRQLLATYDRAAVEALPARFDYNRRFVAVLCGTAFLHLARAGRHPGADATETLASALDLGQCYERMRAGALSIAAADGQWTFGLALIKVGASLP